MPPLRHRLAAAALAATLAACGGDAAEDVEDTLAAIEGDQSAMTAPTSDAAPSDAPVTVEDIDRWQRGMTAELEAVRAAGERLASATTGTDSVSAIFDANDMATREEGARGAGVDEERYGHLNSTFSGLVRYMVPLSAEMDTTGMPAEIQKQMVDGRVQALATASAGVPEDVLEALRERAAELRRQELELVGARMKAAGIGG